MKGESIQKKKLPQLDDFLRVPEICPRLNVCRTKVDRIVFDSECNDPMWIFCEHAGKCAEKYLKLPRNWMKIKKLEKALGKKNDTEE